MFNEFWTRRYVTVMRQRELGPLWCPVGGSKPGMVTEFGSSPLRVTPAPPCSQSRTGLARVLPEPILPDDRASQHNTWVLTVPRSLCFLDAIQSPKHACIDSTHCSLGPKVKRAWLFLVFHLSSKLPRVSVCLLYFSFKRMVIKWSLSFWDWDSLF